MIDETANPQLAVVVMSVGAPASLRRAVQSILDQDVAAELVIVNSGGGDVAARMPDGAAHARIVNLTELLWPGAARNRGIAASTAPFIAFLAADCWALPGWVSGRLAHHRAGEAMVASAITNSDPASVVATVAHVAHLAPRDPGIPRARASLYGNSYARWLFDRYGPFREDLRVAEDTEFRFRLNGEKRPAWDSQILTAHDNPTALPQLLTQHHARGRNYGLHWPPHSKKRFGPRVRNLLRARLADMELIVPRPWPAPAFMMRAMVAAALYATQIGIVRGKRKSTPLTRIQVAAQTATNRNRFGEAKSLWRKVLKLAGNAEGPLRSAAQAAAIAEDHVEASRLFGELARLNPRDSAAIIGQAHAVLLAGDGAQAQLLWRQAEALFGRSLPIVEGLALSHIESGDLDAASALYTELDQTHPFVRIGADGLVALAFLQQDWALALDRLHDVATRFRDPEALARVVGLLSYLGRYEEADKCLLRLGAADDDDDENPNSALRAQFRILSSRHQWEAIADLARRRARQIADDLTLLVAFVEGLSSSGNIGLALELIAMGQPAGRAIEIRKTLLAVAALAHQGQPAAAWDAFSGRTKPIKPSLVPAHLLEPLVTGAYEQAGLPAAQSLVRRANTAEASPQLRAAALFQSLRLAGLEGLTNDPPSLLESEAPEQLVAPLLQQLLATPNGRCEHGLAGACHDDIVRLSASRPDMALYPAFLPADALKAAAAIARAVRDARPFSLLRLGDGEGNMLPYRGAYGTFQTTDIAATQRTWWGRSLDARGDELAASLRASIDNADVLGIPDFSRLFGAVSQSKLRAPDGGGRNARGLLASFDYGIRPGPQMLTSCHIHQAFGFWGLWDILLPQFGSVSLVTCHAELGQALSARFGLVIEATHLVPSEHKHAVKFETQASQPHFPDAFDALRSRLANTPRGHVVLVAAGMLGKIYCDWIKAAGGIALDVGSAADSWCGYQTRSAHENVRYLSPAGIRSCFEKLAETDPLVASVVHLRG